MSRVSEPVISYRKLMRQVIPISGVSRGTNLNDGVKLMVPNDLEKTILFFGNRAPASAPTPVPTIVDKIIVLVCSCRVSKSVSPPKVKIFTRKSPVSSKDLANPIPKSSPNPAPEKCLKG